MNEPHAECLRWTRYLAFSFSLVLPFAYPALPIHAASPITPSGLNTQVTLSGTPPAGKTQYNITGGTRPGGGVNLYQSFGNFNVPTNTIANFLNSGSVDLAGNPLAAGLPTSNILARVNGGNPSSIFGMIQTNGPGGFPNANLFLMNPNGFLFGANASINVGGMATFTTADTLRLADNTRFNAVAGPADVLLTAAPVAAFGFLGSNPAAISIQGSTLQVADGKALSLVGGNQGFTATDPDSGNPINVPGGITMTGGKLSAPGGQINITSVAGRGEISAGDFMPAPGMAMGNISLSQGAIVQTSSSTGPAGAISIKGGQLVMENATLEATSSFKSPNLSPDSILSASNASGDTSIQADGVSLSKGSTITTATSGDVNAGNIKFEVGTLRSNMGTDDVPLTGAAPVAISSNSTGRGNAGTISIGGRLSGPADMVLLSNTNIGANVSGATIPALNPLDPMDGAVLHPKIVITGEHVELANGTVLRADSAGGADAGSITMNVGTLKTQSGPDGRVLLSSSSDCGAGCLGGQAGNITVQGIAGVTPTETRTYVWVGNPDAGATVPLTYHLARDIDLHGTDIRSEAIGHAPGAQIYMRSQGRASFTDTNISVTTQDFDINGTKPNGDFAGNAGFSRIDILANDIVFKNSTISADAKVSDIGSCPFCQGGPSAGEIWLRAGNSVTLENSAITNTGSGRAQAGIVKIIGDNFFSFGAIWEPDFADHPTGTVRLTNSAVTVEAKDVGIPGFLRVGADNLVLDHSVLNSTVNNVSNSRDPGTGAFVDVVGAGERSRVIIEGRDVQGSIVVSAKSLDIIGGGIIAPTQGNRIGSRIEIHADHLTTQPGTRPGGTLANPQILDPADPTRVVISSGSTGSGGAGTIRIVGALVPMPEECCTGVPRGGWPPASSIHLTGTDVLTNSGNDALGGKIELKSSGPIQLDNTIISSNVHNLRPQSLGEIDQGGTITVSAGSLSMHGSTISTVSTGSQNGGNIFITAKDSVTARVGSRISASNTGSANAGDIQVNAGNQFAMTNSAMTTEANQASGGTIKITTNPSGMVQLTNSMISASVFDGTGGGGSVNIDPQAVILQNSQILANAVFGPGGNINIITNLLFPDSASVISASSQFGQQGIISIQSPIAPASGKIIPLGQKPLVETALVSQRCAAITGGNISSFTVAGRDSLPIEPSGWLSSPLALAAADNDGRPPNQMGLSEPTRPILSLRRIAPPGFLTQSFGGDTSSDCTS